MSQHWRIFANLLESQTKKKKKPLWIPNLGCEHHFVNLVNVFQTVIQIFFLIIHLINMYSYFSKNKVQGSIQIYQQIAQNSWGQIYKHF